MPQEGKFESGDCLHSLYCYALYLEFFFIYIHNSLYLPISRKVEEISLLLHNYSFKIVICHCGRLTCTLKYGKKKTPEDDIKWNERYKGIMVNNIEQNLNRIFIH